MSTDRKWKYKVGPHGARVTAAERTPGGPVYLLAYDPTLNGNRKRSLGFRVRDANGALIPEMVEAAKKQAAALSNRLLMNEAPCGQVTVGELFDLFRREVLVDQKPRQRYETRRDLELLERFLGRRSVVSRLGVKEWRSLIRQRSSGEINARGNRVVDPDKKRPVRDRTIQKTLKVLRQTCRFGTHYRRREGGFLLEVDPTRGLEMPSERNPAQPVCDDRTYEALVAVANRVTMRLGDRTVAPSYLRELLVLAASTGRRIGSIVALRFSDWLPDEGTYGSLRWRAEFDKLGRDSVVPVSPEVRETIDSIIRRRPGVGEAWLFPSPASKGHLTVSLACRWLRKAEGLAEIKHVRGFGFHALRRRFATERKHMSVVDVAAAGGWKDTATLQRCYQHTDRETLEEVVFGPRRLNQVGSG